MGSSARISITGSGSTAATGSALTVSAVGTSITVSARAVSTTGAAGMSARGASGGISASSGSTACSFAASADASSSGSSCALITSSGCDSSGSTSSGGASAGTVSLVTSENTSTTPCARSSSRSCGVRSITWPIINCTPRTTHAFKTRTRTHSSPSWSASVSALTVSGGISITGSPSCLSSA